MASIVVVGALTQRRTCKSRQNSNAPLNFSFEALFMLCGIVVISKMHVVRLS